MSPRTTLRAAGLGLGLILVFVSLGTGFARGQEAEARPATQESPLFGVSSALVQVDVVVRDDRGRAVRDLTQDDFEVYEDGEPQTIQSFRVVSLEGLPRGQRVALPARADSAAGDAAAPAADEAPAAVEPTVLVFVFDRLTTEGRDTAYKAAKRYLEKGHVQGDIVAVFAIDQALHLLQDFTVEREEIAAAFDLALRQANTDYASTRGDARDASRRAQALEEQAAASSDPAQAGALGADATLAVIESRIARGFDRLERDQQGYATANGLLAIVDGLKPLPGRKTIVFFSEGLSLPSNLLARFRSVIASANRAQVSVYSIDAGGLRTQSTNRESADELMSYARQRERQEASGSFAGADSPMTQRMEEVEDSLRYNPQSGLGQLAEETGGFLVADTNDASEGFERIQEDMRFHYVLAYTPSDPSYDGRFREIRVEVDRKKVRVQSRKGYFAIPPDVVVPVQSFEAPALAALDQKPAPNLFPMKATALSFPTADRPGRVAIFAGLPVGAMAFRAPTSAERTDHEADFAVVARVSDENGNEVDRVSQHYPLSVPPESLEAAKKGDVLFYKEVDLAPGRYVVEAVAYDAITGAASVAESPVEVPDANGGLRLSSLTLVRRAEQLPPEERQGDNPLIYGELMLYPSLGDDGFSKEYPLTFFVTVYGAGAGVESTLELLKGGEALVELPTPLPEADASGRIQYAGTLNLESLPPGAYGLRLNATGGGVKVSREAEFRVIP